MTATPSTAGKPARRWPRKCCSTWPQAAKTGAAPKADTIYLDAIGRVLDRAEDDMAFAAQMLMPPGEGELALAMTPADPDAIHAARMALIRRDGGRSWRALPDTL